MKNPRIVRIFMDYTGSGELKSVLIHVIRGPSLVILKGINYICFRAREALIKSNRGCGLKSAISAS
ncbi:MAG: hypothetical protein LBD18_07700 [Treponema sp.]|nr:hypothetical protein [Treponema sp.]